MCRRGTKPRTVPPTREPGFFFEFILGQRQANTIANRCQGAKKTSAPSSPPTSPQLPSDYANVGPELMDLVRLDEGRQLGHGPGSYAVDAIAIHGLNGHYERTWTDQRTGALWLRDTLPIDAPGARIYSFSYDSRIFSDTVMTISDYALKLLSSISSERTTEEERLRPIFFFCHSLGGLVAKKALVLATQDLAYRNTADMTKGIAFFGTPHSGSSVADKAGPVFNIVKALNQNIRNDHLKTLGGKQISEELLSISQSFRFLSTGRVLISIYETRPTPPMNVIVVPKDSALTNLPNEVQIPRNTDHRALCRFASREDGCYVEVLGLLKQLLDRESTNRRVKAQEELTTDEAKCLHSLYISEYENHKAAVEKPVGGTCRWILNNPIYRSWLTSLGNTVLWISGSAGCGKSVAAAFLIDALREDTKYGRLNATICYHFFSDRDSSQKFGHFALCSVLHQLISANLSHIKHIFDAYQKKGSQITRDLRTLWEILVDIISDPATGNVILVLDALEECAEESRQRLLDWIIELSTERSPFEDGRLKIILTGRPEYSIQTKLRGGSVQSLRMEDDIDSLESDIKAVISTKIAVFGYSKGLAAFVLQQLVEKADGTFLWISLILRLLEESGDSSHRGVMEVLQTSSRGHDLFNVYQGILNRVPAPRRIEARKVLQIVATAPRPLTLDEFNIAFVLDHTEPPDGTCDLDSRLQQDLPRFLLRLCGPFIRIVDGSVRLVHQTAKEFLYSATPDDTKSTWALEPVESDLFLARCCIWYLLNHSAAPLSSTSDLAESWSMDREHQDVFVAYASTYWPVHFSSAGSSISEDAIRDAVELHQLAAMGLSPWLGHYWTSIGFSGDPIPGLSPLITASIAGHEPVIRFILQAEREASIIPDSEGRNALHWACRCGHGTAAGLLLQSGLFDVDGSDSTGYTALWWTAWGGHTEVASALLRNSVIDINGADKTGRTPLHIAAWLGHDSITRMLLPRPEIRTDVKDSNGWTALTWASWRGRTSIVRQFVLRHDIKATAASQDRYRRTPLARACEKGRADVARQLLKVSDPVTRDKEQRTPLSLAAQAGNTVLVKLLLSRSEVSKRADEPDESGQTPLCWAASEGHEAVVSLFISRSLAVGRDHAEIDIDSPLYDEQTPLSIAAANGHLGVVRQLFEAGASLSSQDMDDKTPLWWAASRGRTDVVRFLLSHGVDPNVAGRDFGLLLPGQSVDPSVAGHDGSQAPLIVATQEGFAGVVRELVRAKDIRIDVKDRRGRSALLIAAQSGRAEVVMRLLGGTVGFSVGDVREAAAAAAAAQYPSVSEAIRVATRREDGRLAERRRASEPQQGAGSHGEEQSMRAEDGKGPGKWNFKGLGRRFT